MTASFALFIALLMLAGGAAVERREERRAQRRTREILDVALQRAQAEVDEDELHALNESLLTIAKEDTNELAAGGLVLVVADARGVLWKSRNSGPDWPQVGDNWRYRTLSRQGQTLIVAREWKPVEDELYEMAASLWGLGTLIVVATTMAAWFLVGKTLSPLDELAAQAENASVTALHIRLQSPSSDAEMRHLTATLNGLLARLEKEAKAHGRFYAAASHELRTPIQALLGQIDVARSRPRAVAQHEEILAQLGAEVERLTSLVQDLLQLNALEMGQSRPESEQLDLKFWVERAMCQQTAGAEAKGLVLESHLESCEVAAPPNHIQMLLRNLMENAVKYAPAHGCVRINLHKTASGARFTVWNAANLPEESDLSLWFEPFFRPDESRNSQSGGNGLGLSVVAALATANGWQVTLDAIDGGVRACFIVNPE